MKNRNHKSRRRLAAVLVVLLTMLAAVPGLAQSPLGTAFTYQGRLTDGGSPADGDYDFEFKLYDDPTAGSQVGSTVTVDDETVTDGLFTVQLDFGAVFTGNALYLETGVRPGSDTGAYTTLSPRQELTAAPYALYALDVATHDHWGESWTGTGTGLTLSGGSTGLSGSGTTYGVYGYSSGYGVYGESSGSGTGVRGYNTSNGTAVDGWSTSGTGVAGSSTNGYGVYGSSTNSYGVYGESSGSNAGVHGYNNSGGPGVYGYSSSYGVYGESSSSYGVYGTTNSGEGYAAVSGNNSGSGYGVHGSSTGGPGVYGTSSSSSDAGVLGINDSGGEGVYGTSTTGYGVYGTSSSGKGVYGTSSSGSNAGVDGYNNSGGPGVHGWSSHGYGVYGYSGTSYAGYFYGDVEVTGNLSKGGGSFKIDHPLDPENQYLYHSFVESPDMMNVYNGNAILDENGEAWVELPDWFEALNGGKEHRSDFRYQLTPIGAPGPNLYIAQEVANNRFQIAGGTPGMKVSWQVTGIRHDPYAEANRIPVEEAKPPEEQGTYLHPGAYGQPETKGLDYKEPQGGGE